MAISKNARFTARSLARILVLGLCAPSVSQTVTTQPQTTTAPVIPAGTTLCSVPKNGGACKTPAQITLKALTVPAQTFSVNLSGTSLTISCSLPLGTNIQIAPDGTLVIPPLNCTAVKQ